LDGGVDGALLAGGDARVASCVRVLDRLEEQGAVLVRDVAGERGAVRPHPPHRGKIATVRFAVDALLDAQLQFRVDGRRSELELLCKIK
jgi:hypothetical protein